jgi:hypothetical protein
MGIVSFRLDSWMFRVWGGRTRDWAHAVRPYEGLTAERAVARALIA